MSLNAYQKVWTWSRHLDIWQVSKICTGKQQTFKKTWRLGFSLKHSLGHWNQSVKARLDEVRSRWPEPDQI